MNTINLYLFTLTKDNHGVYGAILEYNNRTRELSNIIYDLNNMPTPVEVSILALTEILTVLKEPCNIKVMTYTGNYFKDIDMSLVFEDNNYEFIEVDIFNQHYKKAQQLARIEMTNII